MTHKWMGSKTSQFMKMSLKKDTKAHRLAGENTCPSNFWNSISTVQSFCRLCACLWRGREASATQTSGISTEVFRKLGKVSARIWRGKELFYNKWEISCALG